MRRVDVLGDEKAERFAVLGGEVLDRTLDDALQALAQQAARELNLPIALVSLVLERTQFFRAHVGLSPELALARATDRDASFCQFVVRDGARFEVEDARVDDRVPKELVELHGVQSYLGEPISVQGTVVGSFCVIGTEPRTFTDADRAVMARLAVRVSERLNELAIRSRSSNRGLIAHAAKPAFGEARNILMALTMNARLARVAVADTSSITALLRSARPAEFAALTNAVNGMTTLGELIADIDDGTQRLVTTFEALDGLVAGAGASAGVGEIIAVATTLSRHATKLVGGVAWSPISPLLRVGAPKMVAVSVLSTALSSLADLLAPKQSGIQGAAFEADAAITIELLGDLTMEASTRCAAELTALIDQDPHSAVTAVEHGLRIRLSPAPI